MKFIAIIQARMGSTRLPGKVLMPFHGKSIIQWVVERVKNATRLEKVIVSIPDTSDNDILESHLKASNYVIFRGSEDDLVKRFYDASRCYPSDAIIRVCADNPLICPKEVDRLINYFAVNKCDYAYNHIPLKNSYPDGLGAEICSFDVLDSIYNNANKSSQREHVFNYIWENQELFNIKTFDAPDSIAYPELKFDVDTREDYMNLLKKEYRISMNAEEIINLNIN
jgi:spore coat polysaccharide biosynthesis protein SpsF